MNLLSSLREEESLPALEEDDDEPQVMEVKTAAGYLSGSRDFAAAHNNPDLLALISKRLSIVEELMWEQIKKTKQTQMTGICTV